MEADEVARSRPRSGWLLIGDSPAAAALGDVASGAPLAPADMARIDEAIDAFRPRVVVVFAPSAAWSDVALVAARRRAIPGLRAALVTPWDGIQERVRGLRLGYDEACSDTMPAEELAERLRLLAERRPLPRRGPVRRQLRADLELDLDAHALRNRGEIVHLRPLELRILQELVGDAGHTLSRGQLLDRVWGVERPADERTVDVHIRWLREKIETVPKRPRLLRTVRGVGYRFDPEPTSR